MGAGPTKQQIASGRRKVFQTIAKKYGGIYVPATGKTPNAVQGEGWSIGAELLRASNGEAALLFHAVNSKSMKLAKSIGYNEALAQVGVQPVEAVNG